jgi:hypothetical protein
LFRCHGFCSAAIVPFNLDEMADANDETLPIGPRPRPPNPIDVGTRSLSDSAVGADKAPAAEWACSVCTYNNKASDTSCDMCGTPK